MNTTINADNDARRKTCQICGRHIIAKDGYIVNHGYQQRGYLSARATGCPGAFNAPLEVSTERLRKYIDTLRNMIPEAKSARDARQIASDIKHFEKRLNEATN